MPKEIKKPRYNKLKKYKKVKIRNFNRNAYKFH